MSLPPSLSLALPVSHTRIYLLWPQRRAQLKTLEVEVCQYFKERPNHLRVNLLSAGNATRLTPAPISPPPTKKNTPLPRFPSSFLLQALAIPGVSLQEELNCDKRLVVFNNQGHPASGDYAMLGFFKKKFCFFNFFSPGCLQSQVFLSCVCKRGVGGGSPHTGGDPDRLCSETPALPGPPRLASGPYWGRPGSPAVPAPPPEPGGRRGRGARTSRPRGGGGSGRVRSLSARPGRGGVGPRGVAPGLSPPARGCAGAQARPTRVPPGSGLPAWAGEAPRPPPSGPGQPCWLRPGPRTGGTHPWNTAPAMPPRCSPVPLPAARSPIPAAANDDLGSTEPFGVGGPEGVKLTQLAVQNGPNPC